MRRPRVPQCRTLAQTSRWERLCPGKEITGRPAAIASSAISPNASAVDGIRKTSHAEKAVAWDVGSSTPAHLNHVVGTGEILDQVTTVERQECCWAVRAS